MDKMTCINCLYCDTTEGRFKCKRFPPKSSYLWPEIYPGDWCGEFQFTRPDVIKARNDRMEKTNGEI